MATYRASDHPRILPVPAFDDNYIWLVRTAPGHALVVDPGDPAPVRAALEASGLRLDQILVTHHHGDHVGGVAALKALWPDALVVGPGDGRSPAIDRVVGDGDAFTTRQGAIPVAVLHVPGHTTDHLAYRLSPFGDDPRPVLFCGDTLFAGGCGRLFEGTPADMHRSLGRLAALAPETLVYCAHEYTRSNLAFARVADPANAQVAARQDEAASLRAGNRPTVPSTIAIERATNPFLRCDDPTVAAAVAAGAPGRADGTAATAADPVAVLAAMRQWKNAFRA